MIWISSSWMKICYVSSKANSSNPDEFEIAETYQFKGTQESNDTYVIYAIRSVHRDLKGILMTSYSAFNHGLGIHLWSKLSTTLRVS